MWICSKFGFFSFVAKNPGQVWQVRARSERELRELISLAAIETEIRSGPETDYAGYVDIDQASLQRVFKALADSIDYAHFKEGLDARPDQRDKFIAYDDLWHALRKLQADAEAAERGAAPKSPGEVVRSFGGHLARVLETLNGFKDKYGHWPTRLRLSHTACAALREKHLTRMAFSTLASKLELKIGDAEEIIATDDAGLSFDYSKEGWASRRPPQEADNWLWQLKL